MSKIAIITARGGSKRIPGKNIKVFCGQPIIAYSIAHAQQSGLFDEIMVSTDDPAIAKIAKELGAKVPFMRSATNSDDHATTADVLLEVLGEYEKNGKSFEQGCCIYPTAPFANAALLTEGYELMGNNNFDTVFPVMKFGFPIQRALKIKEQNKIELFQPEHALTRSQDLEAAYHDAGQFYWFNIDRLKDKRKLWSDNSGVIIISEMQAQDIDYPEDWAIAEFKFKLLHASKT